jgi:ABC-2 type transport system ATP-binding protein
VALRKSLWAFIRRLHEEGHTIVLTTHYLEEAELLCDRIAILNHGNVVALDTKQALLQRGIGKTVNVWITADEPVPALSAELQAVLRAQDGTRLEFRLDNKLNSIGDLLEGLRRAGLVITDLHTEEPDLEDVFLDLTRGREE